MAAYYQNAYLTISVALATDCDEGFFIDRLPPRVLPCEVNYTPEKSSGRRESPVTGAYMGFLKYYSDNDRDPDPIDTRAWTLQEYELSPRILSFKADHFSFLCQQQLNSERHQTQLRTQEVPGLQRTASYPQCSWCAGIPQNIRREWKVEHVCLVVQHCQQVQQREMTNLEDKFAAIAGIAKAVQKCPKANTYLEYGKMTCLPVYFGTPGVTGPPYNWNQEKRYAAVNYTWLLVGAGHPSTARFVFLRYGSKQSSSERAGECKLVPVKGLAVFDPADRSDP